MRNDEFAGLRRPRQPMPDDVLATLKELNLVEAYNNRPPYQRNDYLWWITAAKREDTRQRRIRQMLEELQAGNLYMNMSWKGTKSHAGE